jgi:hypothetical protein
MAGPNGLMIGDHPRIARGLIALRYLSCHLGRAARETT